MTKVTKYISLVPPCTIDQYLDIYKSLFCNETNIEADRGNVCDEILSDPAGWISGLRDELKDKSTSDYWRKVRRERIEAALDPHNCQASCLTPDYGCDACTNTSYFRCPVNGEPHCLHPHLECDGHPQCDNAEDEDLLKCRQALIKLKKIKQIATYRCLSKMYPHKSHYIAAVACDGIADGCQEDQDETEVCQNLNLFTWIGVPISFVIMVCIAAGYKCYSDDKEEKKMEEKEKEKITEKRKKEIKMGIK